MKILLRATRSAAELRQDGGQVKHIATSQKLNFPKSLERWEYYVSASFLLESLLSSSSRVSSVDFAYLAEPCTTHWHRGLG